MQAIEFPTAKVKGCFYLFAQAIWEKFNQLAIKIATKKSKIPENSSKGDISRICSWMGWIKD